MSIFSKFENIGCVELPSLSARERALRASSPDSRTSASAVSIIPSFVILILGIVLFFVYDKFLKKEKVETIFDLRQEQIIMNYNQVYDLSNIVILKNIEQKELNIISSDTNLITIDNYKLISGNIDGEVNIILTYKKITKNLKVTINDGIDRTPKLLFLKNKIDLNKNYSKDIYDYLSVKNIDIEKIEFVSTNTNVAEVKNGKIDTFEKEGTAIIKAKYNDLETQFKIVVGSKYLYFKETEIILEKKKKYLITDYIDSLNVENTNIIYKINDLSIVYIEDGKLRTREKDGETIITASVGDLVTKAKIIVR